MNPSPQDDLAAQYAQMSETELMELARSYDDLLEIAQAALREEFARRGLEPPLVEDPEEWDLRRLVIVRRYRDLTEALVGRSLLESAGIPAWIADENLARMNWFFSNLLGGVRLQVDESNQGAPRRSSCRDSADNHLRRGRNLPAAHLPKVRLGRDYAERGRSLVALYVRHVRQPGTVRLVAPSGSMKKTVSTPEWLSQSLH